MSRLLAALAAVLCAVMLAVPPASAHDPIFFSEDQTTPQAGPLLPDGTVSFALYGSVAGPGDSRGFQVRFADGDRLLVELLIPDRPPEVELAIADLPVAVLTAPDGSATELRPELREAFNEVFTATRYVRLARLDTEAQEGLYDVTVTGAAPARFTVAVGTRETFGTPVERVPDRLGAVASVAGPLREWYGAEPLALSEEDGGGWPTVGIAAAGVAAALVVLGLVRRKLAGGMG